MSTKEKQVNLSDLSPAARTALLKQLQKQQREEEEKVHTERKGYKEQVNKKIPQLFTKLKQCSQHIAAVKLQVYKQLQSLVAKKGEVYGREQDQGSHSFTSEEGITITIGYRQNDGWDDTVEVGLQKVTDYIQSLGKDANSKKLVKTIMQLLQKDKTGTLKSSRVLQLKKLADEIGDPVFIDAIKIIQDAYRPARSKQFVTCRYKDDMGKSIDLPLNISDAELVLD